MADFRENFLPWALEDSHREVRQGYPLLRSCRESSILRLIAHLEKKTLTEQLVFFEILVLRFHGNEPLDMAPYRNSAADVLREYMYIIDPIHFDEFRVEELSRKNENVKGKKLIRCIHDEISYMLGESEISMGKGVHAFRKQITREISLLTTFDIGGRYAKLSYGHRLRRGREDIYSEMSLLSWLGLRSQTEFSYIPESELLPTIAALKQMIELFMNAVPRLVGE